MNRRNFLRLGIGAAIAAPALVSRANIMAIKVPRPTSFDWLEEVLFPPGERWWMFIHPDVARELRIAVDPSDRSDHAAVSRYERQGGHVIIRDVRFIESPNLVFGNYGRGPGQLTESALGVRSWNPQRESTARELEAKRAEAYRQMRRWLEPKGSRRWV